MNPSASPAAPATSSLPAWAALEAKHLARSFPPKPVAFERGAGHRLFTADGTEFVDLGGASHGVANFGHSHPRIVAAVQEQAARLTYATNTVPSRPRADMLERLHRLAPSHLPRTFLSNSGAEAVEAAVKYAHARTKRKRIVAMKSSFHGRTIGALSATFRAQYREPFQSLLIDTTFSPLNDEAALEAAVTDETSLVLIEPVQGEGGLAVADPAFMRAAQRIAHEHGALLCIDEIQTGLGRTGTDLAIDGTGVQPDLLCLGKSLAGGLPVGATLMSEDVAAAMPAGGHGSTFGGSPIVCAAAAAALDVLRDERLAEQARASGEHLRARLEGLASPAIREARGRGLMLGLDLRIRSQGVLDQLLAQRWLALSAGPTVLRLLPPLAIPRDVLDRGADAIAAILASAGPSAGAVA